MTRIGLNGATLPKRDLIAKIAAAAAAGFDLYEPRVPELLTYDTPSGRRDVEAAMSEAGLAWLPLNALEGVFSSVDGGAEAAAETVFPLAARFGVTQVIAVPAPPDARLDRSTAVAALARLVERAAGYSLTLLYELIGFPHHAFPSLESAAALTRDAGIPMVLDTFHLAVSEASIDAIADLAPDRIGLVHLSDAILGGGPVTAITDGDRVLPDEGDLPLEGLVAAIGRTGFDGPISVEVFHPKYADEDADRVAERALEEARRLTATWG